MFLQNEGVSQGRGSRKIKKAGDLSQEIHSETPQDDGKGSPRVALGSWPGEQPVQAGAGVWGALPGGRGGTISRKKMSLQDGMSCVVLRDCYLCREVSDELVINK